MNQTENKTQLNSDQTNGEAHFSSEEPKRKNRKNPQLWQSYQTWNELMEMRKRHLLRISSAERGVSQVDIQLELDIIKLLNLDLHLEPKNKVERELSIKTIMLNYGYATGPIWEWLLSHKGIGEGLAAQLLAQIDDVSHFPNVAKLWRFAGFAVFNGKAESKGSRGDKRHYNGMLKGICFNIADQFIRQQTPYYVDIYYAEKEKQRQLHPIPFCVDCNRPAEQYKRKVNGVYVNATRCPEKDKNHVIKWSDLHIHTMAWRKMIKEFLKNLWVKWSEASIGMKPKSAVLKED